MIQFYLKTPKEKDSLIMMRIYDAQFKDGVFHYSTRERIETSKWNKEDGWPKNNTNLNKILRDLSEDAEELMRANKRTGYTRELLRNHLNAATLPPPEIKEELSLNDQYLNFLDSLIKGSKKATTTRLHKAIKDRFLHFTSEKGHVKCRDFDFDLYTDFLVYLRGMYSVNTEALHLNTFKRGMKFIVRSGNSLGFDIMDIKYRSKSGVRIALSFDELNKMAKLDLTGHLNDVRWLFVIQCSTGLRVSDLFRLAENIRGEFICIETRKVEGKRIVQPLTPIVKSILEMYNGRLPQMSEIAYRKGIKLVYKKVNPNGTIEIRNRDVVRRVFIHQEISTHDAVRTFITLAHREGMTVDEIAAMVGKTTNVILKYYLVESEEDAQKGMIKVWGGISDRLLTKMKIAV